MYKGLFRLGILTIIVSFLIVPGGFGSSGWSGLSRQDFSYKYVIESLTYAADQATFVVGVCEHEDEWWVYKDEVPNPVDHHHNWPIRLRYQYDRCKIGFLI